jgi:hypothetical protein
MTSDPDDIPDEEWPVLPPRGFKPNSQRPLDPNRKAIFLSHLSRHGIVSAAARAASPHLPDSSKDGGMSTFYACRKRDVDFAQAWDISIAIAADNVEAEIHRRGCEGYEEDVYFRGEKVGTTRKYSDNLLLARMKALDPTRYGNKVDVTSKVEIEPLGIEDLNPAQRELMRKLLLTDANPVLEIEEAQDVDVQEEE